MRNIFFPRKAHIELEGSIFRHTKNGVFCVYYDEESVWVTKKHS